MNTAVYGLMAEFKKSDELLSAVKKVHAAGFRAVDAYSPFPVEGVAEELGQSCQEIGWIAFFSGVLGILAGLALQYYTVMIAYPMNIGGRPLNSWPSFIPVCFELMILFAALGTAFSMFILNRLPQFYHPVFNAQEFTFSTQGSFFILIEKKDPLFDLVSTRALLESLNAKQVIEVSE